MLSASLLVRTESGGGNSSPKSPYESPTHSSLTAIRHESRKLLESEQKAELKSQTSAAAPSRQHLKTKHSRTLTSYGSIDFGPIPASDARFFLPAIKTTAPETPTNQQQAISQCVKLYNSCINKLTRYIKKDLQFIKSEEAKKSTLSREKKIALYVLYKLKLWEKNLDELNKLSNPEESHVTAANNIMINIKEIYDEWLKNIDSIHTFDHALKYWFTNIDDAHALLRLQSALFAVKAWQEEKDSTKRDTWINTCLENFKSNLKLESSSEAQHPLFKHLNAWMKSPDDTDLLAKLRYAVIAWQKEHEQFTQTKVLKKFDRDMTLTQILHDARYSCVESLTKKSAIYRA